MSQFHDDMEALEKKCCKECNGNGEVDDSYAGDISYSTWECGDCDGTGYMKEASDGT